MANWLTTDHSFCYHDATQHTDVWSFDRLNVPGRVTGVADTAIHLWPDAVNELKCRKLIIERPESESRAACRAIFGHDDEWYDKFPWDLSGINARHLPVGALFAEESARWIYEYLTGLPFDVRRWKLLLDFYVHPMEAERFRRGRI